MKNPYNPYNIQVGDKGVVQSVPPLDKKGDAINPFIFEEAHSDVRYELDDLNSEEAYELGVSTGIDWGMEHQRNTIPDNCSISTHYTRHDGESCLCGYFMKDEKTK